MSTTIPHWWRLPHGCCSDGGGVGAVCCVWAIALGLLGHFDNACARKLPCNRAAFHLRHPNVTAGLRELDPGRAVRKSAGHLVRPRGEQAHGVGATLGCPASVARVPL